MTTDEVRKVALDHTKAIIDDERLKTNMDAILVAAAIKLYIDRYTDRIDDTDDSKDGSKDGSN